jgi:hypothetical protein
VTKTKKRMTKSLLSRKSTSIQFPNVERFWKQCIKGGMDPSYTVPMFNMFNYEPLESNSDASLLHNSFEIGEVGYRFHKRFNSDWLDGVVVDFLNVAETQGYNIKCYYTDGNSEELSLDMICKISS